MKYRICIYFWNKFRVQVPSENMYIIPKEIPMLVGVKVSGVLYGITILSVNLI